MSPPRNIAIGAPDAEPLLRPLSPRSVIASLLLGMHPPRARATLLVRWCAHLGIAEGTTRVALSRMVEAGELPARDGRYELAGRLRRRQPGQDWSLAPASLPWDGEWVLWFVRPGSRPAPAPRGAPPGRRGRPPRRAPRRGLGAAGQPPSRGHATRHARDPDRAGVGLVRSTGAGLRAGATRSSGWRRRPHGHGHSSAGSSRSRRHWSTATARGSARPSPSVPRHSSRSVAIPCCRPRWPAPTGRGRSSAPPTPGTRPPSRRRSPVGSPAPPAPARAEGAGAGAT